MRLCIHRGSHQIGGSCVELESYGKRLVIDLGLPLDAATNEIHYLPEISGLTGSDASLLGILVSHPHLDHFGLLSHVSPDVPVGMGPAARRIVNAAAPFICGNWPEVRKGWKYESQKSFSAGTFKITPYLVDHSAYDAYAFLIESENKKVLYSGDIRSHGRKATLFKQMVSRPPKKVNVLLLEGTTIGEPNQKRNFSSESEIEEQLFNEFIAAKGLALVHTSSQNIDRIVSIYRASKRSGRKLVMDLYTAAILEATGNRNIPQTNWDGVALFIPQAQRIQIKKNAWFDLLKRHSNNRIFIERISNYPKKFTLLFRPLHQADLEKGKCLKGSIYIFSMWEGYWKREDYQKTERWLLRNGIPKLSIHTSGHAEVEKLIAFVNAINPEKVVPIHTFFPQEYPKIFPNSEIHNDNEWWEV